MLIIVMMRPAIASPFTNFIAPSMPPCSWLSTASVARLRLASSGVSRFARRSASMLICLPGSASSVKRAPTSATRSEPLAITMNCTVVMIANTTRPTTRLPPTTSLPKLSMMLPASACSRIDLVEAMFSESRNSVVNSSSDGNAESAEMSGTYMVIISSVTLMVMFRPSSMSISSGGSGRIISEMIATTSATMPISPPAGSFRDFSIVAPALGGQCCVSRRAAPIESTQRRIAAMVSNSASGIGSSSPTL